MEKSVFIAEKPSVAQEFAKALHADFKRRDGFLESEQYIVTWCVGHLVTMSYPDNFLGLYSFGDGFLGYFYGVLTHCRFCRRNSNTK